eukprot:7421974-Pyramimonas_sp.AAC.1
MGAIAEGDVHHATCVVNSARVGRFDDAPPVFWRTTAGEGSTAFSRLMRLRNIVWESGQVPDERH